jgi:hypothetical protein
VLAPIDRPPDRVPGSAAIAELLAAIIEKYEDTNAGRDSGLFLQAYL